MSEEQKSPHPQRGDRACPASKDGCFVYYFGVVGEISSGKSTFINGMFGDCLAQAGTDRTTMAPYRFFESVKLNTNVNLAHRVLKDNQQSKQDWEEEQKQLKESLLFWKRYYTPKLKDFYCYDVAPSSLIPHNEFENLFAVMDFPGFNDQQLDDRIFDVLKENINTFDCLIYVIDCQKCLREKASQEYFHKTMKLIKDSVEQKKLILKIVFNKFDLIKRRATAKKFVYSQTKQILQTLVGSNSVYKLDAGKVESFNISGSRLLSEKLVLSNDFSFVLANEYIMDDIDDYVGKYFGDDEIVKMQQTKTIKERMQVYHDHVQNLTAQSDESSQIEVQAHAAKDMANFNGEMAKNSAEELKLVMKQLRGPSAISDNITKKLDTAENLDKEDRCKDFFDTAAITIKYICSVDEKKVMSNDAKYQNFREDVKRIVKDQLGCFFESLTAYRVRNNMVYFFKSLQHSIGFFREEELENVASTKKIVSERILTEEVLDAAAEEMDLSINSTFFDVFSHHFIDYNVDNFCRQLNRKQWYRSDNGGKILNLVRQIEKFCDKSKELKKDQIKRMVLNYDQRFDKTKHEHGRALDRILYYFDMDQIRFLFNYDEYDIICCKLIEKDDQIFQELIQSLRRALGELKSSSVKPSVSPARSKFH